jgi:hypothetical protein
MPWTFAHPAAIVALRRWCPAYLSLPALVVGAIAPDVGHYVGQTWLAHDAHTLAGSFVLCLPIGFALLGLLYLLRRPLCHLLPQPHRGMLEPLIDPRVRLRIADLIRFAASILLGAWTHIAWDAFTHPSGWAVVRVEWLRQRVFTVGETNVPVYWVLQHASTLAGVVVLVVVYAQWARRLGKGPLLAVERDDRWRHAIVAALSIASVAIAGALALDRSTAFDSFDMRGFVFLFAVHAAALFIPMLVATALACYAVRPAGSR